MKSHVKKRPFILRTQDSAILLLMAALVMIFGYACGDDDDEIQSAQGNTRVRAIHLSPDAPDVDIYVAEEPPAAVTDLAFGESTPYVDLDAGTYTFNLTVAGEPPPPPSVLDIGPVALSKNKAYTAVAFNEVASIEALALEDDLSSTGTGNIRLRAIHVAPDVGEVDIWNVTDPENPAALYTDVNFGDVGGYYVVPAGPYTLGFDLDNDEIPELSFETGDLPAGSILNVFAVNQGSDVFLIAQFLDGTTVRIDPAPARVRVIHLSPTAPPVDVYVNGNAPAAVEDLAFKEGTGYLNLDADTYTFNVTAAGAPAPPPSVLDIGPADLLGGAFYTAAAINLLLGPIEGLTMEDNNSNPGAGNIRVRAIHAAPGVGEVDIWEVSDLQNPVLLYENVNFRDVGDYLLLPAGAYMIGFDVDDDGVPDLTFSTPALPEGIILNLFAVNQVNDIFLIAQFQNGTVAQIDPM